ncbi:HEPN domain-containing protein [Rhodococcus opacus]|uniref:HEPN domain-containing protein n=1 Tax=Rhodococcus opacus TaxID=37919 RepID=A0AAX3YQ62_RHOOP|nr:HEPN domain-containing protein [Rhodococcus opacus]MCZ4590639.1 HEPN domain-containing protein [Rhodococcus opacus]WLF51572.1 HEPN domain-containing protein [Rhodococcus opacus]WLF52631.1 HEPN domain-containing protein [Rhodococcus opacus]
MAADDEASIFRSSPRHVALLPLWSDGTCQTLQFHTLPAEILTNARVRKYVPSDSIGPVQDAAVADLERARALSSGEPVTVPTYVGLGGIRLGDDVDHIGLEGIRLRRTTPLDPGCLNGTTRVWTVAEVDTEIRYLHNNIQKERDPRSGYPTSEPRGREHTAINQEHFQAQIEIVERLRFAVLLSSGVEEALATTEIFKALANPMVGAAAHLPSGLPHNNSAHALSREAADELDEWLPRVANMPDQLLLPMRRLIRAAAERDDPVDRLIDAVIAWEGLFGANPEIKFQVTGAISVLLETEDMTKRSALMVELGKIYGMRSTFVHGSGQVGDKKLSIETVSERAMRAVTLAIMVFREVLQRPDLVAITESKLRSQKVLLGF